MNVPISGPSMKIKAKELALTYRWVIQSFSVAQDGWKDLSNYIVNVIVNLFCIL